MYVALYVGFKRKVDQEASPKEPVQWTWRYLDFTATFAESLHVDSSKYRWISLMIRAAYYLKELRHDDIIVV